MLAALVVFASTLASAALSPSRAEENLPALVAAERGFAADAQTLGVQEAFVVHLAPDAVLFRPQPVKAKDWFPTHKGGPGILEWNPEFAEISASGDFGYTFGPWRFTAKGEKGEDKAWGHFFSVWKRGEDGVWRNVLDHGYSHAEVPLDATLSLRAPRRGVAPTVSDGEREQRGAALLKQDDALNAGAAKPGSETRYFREGVLPSIKLETVATAKGLKRVDSAMAGSADLAYTLGARADGKADGEGGYVRMWRYERDGWHEVADLLTPSN